MPKTKHPLKVFLCHARADKQKVRELYRYLRKRGIQPWLDAEDLVAGQDWRVEIPKAIRASDAIIICLSKNSINKEGFVQTEIAFALEKALEIPPGRIFIIPARFEDCEVPDRLERFQWVDLFEEGGFRRLMKSLRTRAGQLERATVHVPKPTESTPNLDSPLEDNAVREQEESKVAEKVARENTEPEAAQEKARREAAEKVAQEKLQREAAEKARREEAKSEATEKARRERAEHRSTQIRALKETFSRSFNSFKLAVSTAKPFFRIGGVIGVIIVLVWVGSWAIPQIPPLVPMAKTSVTSGPFATVLPSGSPTVFTETIEPRATQTQIVTTTEPGSTSTSVVIYPHPESSDYIDSSSVPMRLVAAGEFTMGSGPIVIRGADLTPDESPSHEVNLDAFYIDKYEVTNRLYMACVDAGVCDPPRSLSSNTRLVYYGNPEFDDYPVINVNWNQASTYCEWRGAKLPTEAQWEKAALGIPGVGDIDCNKANYYDKTQQKYCVGDTTEIGNFSGDVSSYGLHDIAGNVREWIADWYAANYYRNSHSSNPLGPDNGQYRVLRGGAWNLNQYATSTHDRSYDGPSAYYNYVGFRCARDAAP